MALFATIAAAPPPYPPDEIQPNDVGTTFASLSCVAGGPTPQDGVVAAALNAQLTDKMRGHMNAYNTSCARAVVDAVQARGFNQRAGAIAISTVIVETSIANLDGGDLDSVGLFQQRATWGSFAERTNPAIATGKFLDVMQQFYPNGSWNTAPIGEVAADVQRPAAEYRYRYGVEANDAIKIVAALWKGRSGQVSDFNGDGRADVLGVNSAGDLYWYRNNSNDVSTGVKIGQGWGTWRHVFAADFNGDGRADVLG
ncbi:VCBS repeat-containing protein, partial [Nonomuraea sp. NPDC050310]|uniref:FG-GAP repeat domain-containing protein n=1 Tax=Nonomuraea sp. NPDC050310 TaxID=3154935 RepID=UPI0033F62A33